MSERELTIVTVCSYNRARSVMIQLLLERALQEHGIEAEVIGAGFNEEGMPPLVDTVRALHKVGIDASSVRSRRVDAEMVEAADLVLAAERLHVVRIVEDRLDLFAKTFTLPELVQRAQAVGPRAGRPLAEWLIEVNDGRTHEGFLTIATPEVTDPAGMPSSFFDQTVLRIDEWCRTLAAAL